MLKNLLVFKALLALFFFLVYAYISQLGGANHNLLTNILYLVPPILASIAGFYAACKYHTNSPHGRSFLYLSLGVFCLLLGETIWFYLRFILNVDPYPSIADAFYLLGYPFLFVGLANEIRLAQREIQGFSRTAWVNIVVVASVIALAVSYFSIYSSFDMDATFLENAIAIGYGFADLALIVPTLIILHIAVGYGKGRLFMPWMFIFHGFVLTLVADMLFSIFYFEYQNVIYPYTLIDLFFIAAYLALTYGFIGVAGALGQMENKLQKKHLVH